MKTIVICMGSSCFARGNARNVLHDIAAALESRFRKQTSFHFY